MLYRNSFVMYDRGTNSLWVHTTGECVKGELKGGQLEFLSSVVTSWSRWKQAHPKSLVLEGERASGFMGTYAFNDHRMVDFGLSVGQNAATKLYRIEDLARLRVVHDRVGEEDVVVFFDRNAMNGTAWIRDGANFRWDGQQFVDDHGQAWDPILGQPTSVSLDSSRKMRPLPATMWLLDEWHGFYPSGDTYVAPEPAPSQRHVY